MSGTLECGATLVPAAKHAGSGKVFLWVPLPRDIQCGLWRAQEFKKIAATSSRAASWPQVYLSPHSGLKLCATKQLSWIFFLAAVPAASQKMGLSFVIKLIY